jgi:NAD(P)-dependent dehydrogenase (short-subunit alcohol dehydrogenase family)
MRERKIYTPPESLGNGPSCGRLRGRRILVVGGGQTDIGDKDTPIGNGRAIAVLCAREGASVAIADRDRASADATANNIARGSVVVIEANVAVESDVVRMVQEATQSLGGLDGLVLNVGVSIGDPWLGGITREHWDAMFATNLTSHMMTVKEAFPHLGEGSSIVFISSAAGLGAGSQLPAYDSSKSALFGLCRHVAFEGSRNWIRANVVAPGLMDTSIGRLATRGRPKRVATNIPLARQGTGWETAYATLFLLSDESAYITGQILAVDGGLSGI